MADEPASGKAWQIKTTEAGFEAVKGREDFWCLIALSRLINCLRFLHTPLLQYQGSDTPTASRFRNNSFLFSCSLLFEAYNFVLGLGKWYGTWPEFQQMARVLKQDSFETLRATNLYPLRNRLTFHFDPEEFGKQLMHLPHHKNDFTPVFAIGLGSTNEHVYYTLADVCAFAAFRGLIDTSGDIADKEMERLMVVTTSAIGEFMNNAEVFLARALDELGWQLDE